MADTDFVIAWSAGEQILYLAGDEAGVHAVEALEDAARFADYDAGYATFARWCDALATLDGAVLRPDEIEAQFSPDRASPRRPFYATDDYLAALQQQALADVANAMQQVEQAEQSKRLAEADAIASKPKLAALEVLAAEHPDLVAAALEAVS